VAARIAADLGANATVTAEKSILRLGAIHVVSAPNIASAESTSPSP
jgi:hypothetical protein